LSEDFVKVAESNDIGASIMKAVDVGGEKICIINLRNFLCDWKHLYSYGRTLK
jgi:hypothetical protein